MAEPRHSVTDHSHDSDSHRHRLFSLHKLRQKKSNVQSTAERRPSASVLQSSTCIKTPPKSSRLYSISGVHEPYPDAALEEDFSALQRAVISHVHEYYSIDKAAKGASQAIIEHATAGLGIPWPQVLSLLGEQSTRLGALALCIGWTILSRSLLLKLGMSNSPGSTFLPPEIVECFQTFSVGGAVMLGAEDPNTVNFALLSRWKQVSATLMHATYIRDAFSHFDSRTVNIERALNDLDPLLQIYASDNVSKTARMDDLRTVLKRGATFAFVLFAQPSFWQLDWIGPEGTKEQEDSVEKEKQFTQGNRQRMSVQDNITPEELVIWPALLPVMDGEGRRVQGEMLGKKMILTDFA